MMSNTNRTWAEIDLANLEHNYHTLRAMLPAGCRFLGIVKANAYGHGAVQIARKLEELGAEYLAVACIDEAEELRRAGVSTPILILGGTHPVHAGRLFRSDVTQTVYDLETARAFSNAAAEEGRTLRVHVKVDTGMSRLGWLCVPEQIERTAQEIAEACTMPGLEVEGIFTHFSDADSSEEYTMLQFTRFLDLLDLLKKKKVHIPIRHCAASAAVLHYPCTHLDMVRPGIALYGHYPDPSCEGLDGPGLLPVMRLKSRVISVKQVPAGTPVSYGRTRVLDRDTTLAVLPVGYADGLPRVCSDRMQVWLNGRRVPVMGRICMDLCMADVTDLPQTKVGDVAEVFGDHISVEELAGLAGTIQYELLTKVSPRVPRILL